MLGRIRLGFRQAATPEGLVSQLIGLALGIVVPAIVNQLADAPALLVPLGIATALVSAAALIAPGTPSDQDGAVSLQGAHAWNGDAAGATRADVRCAADAADSATTKGRELLGRLPGDAQQLWTGGDNVALRTDAKQWAAATFHELQHQGIAPDRFPDPADDLPDYMPSQNAPVVPTASPNCETIRRRPADRSTLLGECLTRGQVVYRQRGHDDAELADWIGRAAKWHVDTTAEIRRVLSAADAAIFDDSTGMMAAHVAATTTTTTPTTSTRPLHEEPALADGAQPMSQSSSPGSSLGSTLSNSCNASSGSSPSMLTACPCPRSSIGHSEGISIPLLVTASP